MNRIAAIALALIAFASPALALDVQVLTEKSVYQSNEIVNITAVVRDYIPQTRIQFVITGPNVSQHYGGRGIFNGGVVKKIRRVQPAKSFGFGGPINPAEKGDFTITAIVFNPPGKGGARAESATTYHVP